MQGFTDNVNFSLFNEIIYEPNNMEFKLDLFTKRI